MRELGRRGATVVRLNSERGPEWAVTLEPGLTWHVGRGGRAAGSARCSGVWWRRPEAPKGAANTPAAEAVEGQWRALLVGMASVPGPVWVSPPAAIRTAEDKANQLAHARALGFMVPSTLWSNQVTAARGFMEHHGGQAVIKSVASAWWEESGRGRFVFASQRAVEHLPTPSALANAPLCFQQPISPKRDVRVTVVEDAVFAAVRDSAPGPTEEPLDWRRAAEMPWSPFDLASETVNRCRRLTAELGLRFAGIDLAVDDEDNHWFLELNPNGEWGWLQQSGLRIAEALCDVLLGGPPTSEARH